MCIFCMMCIVCILCILLIICIYATHNGISRLTSQVFASCISKTTLIEDTSQSQLLSSPVLQHKLPSPILSPTWVQGHLWYNCFFGIYCIYCIMFTCTGRIHHSRRYVPLFANNCYQHIERIRASCRVPHDFFVKLCFQVNYYWDCKQVPAIVTEIMMPQRNGLGSAVKFLLPWSSGHKG